MAFVSIILEGGTETCLFPKWAILGEIALLLGWVRANLFVHFPFNEPPFSFISPATNHRFGLQQNFFFSLSAKNYLNN
jgi:hypothetical protein